MKRLMLLFAATVLTSSAATKIAYDEIPTHIAPFGRVLEYRGVTVTTRDGKTHDARSLLLERDHLRIFHRDNSFEDLASTLVTRIAIRQFGRFFHHVRDSAIAAVALPFMCEPPELGCIIPAALVEPAFAAYAAASTPVFLAADAITFFIPPKVYEIIQ